MPRQRVVIHNNDRNKNEETKNDAEIREDFRVYMQQYQKANDLYANKQFSEALSEFHELSKVTDFLMKKYGEFKEQELHLLSLLRIGFCLMDLERDDEAIVFFKEAYSLETRLVREHGSSSNKKDFADTADMIASLLISQDKCEEALDYYRSSLKMLKELLNEMYHSEEIEKKYEQTKASYENALKIFGAMHQSRLNTFTSSKKNNDTGE